MRLPVSLGCVLILAACSKSKAPPPESIDVPDSCDGFDAGIVCQSGESLTCKGGDVASSQDCGQDQHCTERGCEVCRPDYYACDGNKLMACNHEGTKLSFVKNCEGKLQCSEVGCVDLCAQAEEKRSYVGCEYWPVFTLNSQLDPDFQPAVVVGNPNLVSVHVTLHKGDQQIAQADVPPLGAKTLKVHLATNDVLRNARATTLLPGGAYHLVASAPVIAHQFNPLLFEVEEACAIESNQQPGGDPNQCFSFTNDASLLLPPHVLARPKDGGISYLGMSRTTFMAAPLSDAGTPSMSDADAGVSTSRWKGLSGFLTLVGVGEKPVNVTLRSTAHTLASEDGSFPALSPGESHSFTLAQGDVLQLLSAVPQDCPGTMGSTFREQVCDPGAAYDLTGTVIEADGPVQVIGGHDCTYVPFDRVACDHLEEIVFPLETWGKRVIVGAPRENDHSRYRLRVLSGADGNTVSFDPAIAKPVTLKRGQWHEFDVDQDVLVNAKKPMLVGQYFVGQGQVSVNGDPSLSVIPPVEQWRSQYSFLSPDTYSSNYATVTAPKGALVFLDGDTLLDFQPVGKSGYGITTIELRKSGNHEIHSSNSVPFGLSLYGFGAYTSYMLPGGLDLNLIFGDVL